MPGRNYNYDVGIVGAGFGGIIAALALKKRRRESFIVFERAAGIGGVWRENVYPGCACDVRSNLYSISGHTNSRWANNYASQPEILQYLLDVVSDNGLQTNIRCNADVSSIRFLEADGCWQVYESGRPSCRVRTIILATGPLSRPVLPCIPGIETFGGKSFHSSAWDLSIDLAGKRVAVVGTGASAIQIVPTLAPKVSALTLFQRTPAWVIPRGERNMSRWEQWLFSRFPSTQLLSRMCVYWLTEFIGLAFFGSESLNKLLTVAALRKLMREVHDPETRNRLTPKYKIGCKRILISDTFYPAFNRSNVRLVTAGISQITPRGLKTADGELHEADCIVYATGFIVADIDGYIEVEGPGGRLLKKEWDRDGAKAYLGTNVSGFPNLAILLGPNSGLAHSSALHVMESQLSYIEKYLNLLDRIPETASLDVKQEIQDSYCTDIQKRLKTTVWASGCRSWYLDKAGRNNTIYPGLTCQFRVRLRRFRNSDYNILTSNQVKHSEK